MRTKISLVLTFLVAFGSMVRECVISGRGKGAGGRERKKGWRKETDLAPYASEISVTRRDWRERETANEIAERHYSRPSTNGRSPRIPLNFAVILSLLYFSKIIKQYWDTRDK